MDVALDGVRGQLHFRRDLFVAQPLGNLNRDLSFADRQACQFGFLRWRSATAEKSAAIRGAGSTRLPPATERIEIKVSSTEAPYVHEARDSGLDKFKNTAVPIVQVRQDYLGHGKHDTDCSNGLYTIFMARPRIK